MSQLAKEDAILAKLLALATIGRWDALKRALRQAARQGVSHASVQEILLQSHLFAGFPRCLEAFEMLASVEAMGDFPESDRAAKEGAWSDSMRPRGRNLFETIYAGKANEVLTRIERFHPDLRQWIEEHAYARVLGRPGLTPKQRELASIAALVATRQWKQLLSHLRGAMRCGATREEVAALLREIRPLAAPATISKAKRLVAQM